MNKALNREVLRLALPSVLANITVPLVGMVDSAIAGHIDGPSATFIGSVSVGAMFFSLLYWSFGFLRTGTSGLTAQAFGRKDKEEANKILMRGVGLALLIALVVLVLQTPFIKLVTSITDASQEVISYATRYFNIRVWAAPATLSLFVYKGWFVGMQDSRSSMRADLMINFSNIIISYLLAFKLMGFDGIALGTVCAQYLGLIYCVITSLTKYKLGRVPLSYLKAIISKDTIGSFFKLNINLFIRSLYMTVIYYAYTMIAAGFGDLYLSCSAIMMQLLMLFSYFTDGFAYAGEALTGRFIGANDKPMLVQSVKYSFIWSISLTVLFIGIYAVLGVPLLSLLTNDMGVIEACRVFLPWLMLMPPFGCIAFFFDGVFIGATEAVALRKSMEGAFLAFFGLWFIFRWILKPEGATALHLLFVCYFAHLLFRTIYLSLKYKPSVLSKL